MIIVLLAVFGAAFGSFAGALVWRLHTKRNFVSERSMCESCHHTLAPLDLVPIFSWLFLRGKCRYCHKRISPQSFVLEITTAVLFVLSYLLWPAPLSTAADISSFIFWLTYVVGAVVLVAYDLRWKLLPDKVVFPLIGVAALDVVVNNVFLHGGGSMAIADAGVGALTISGFFATLFFVSKGRWIGFGDVKLGIFMGFVLGAQRALFALVGSYYIGALVILPLLLLRKLSARSHIPFGPFLLIAFYISFFFTDYIVEWYQSLVGW